MTVRIPLVPLLAVALVACTGGHAHGDRDHGHVGEDVTSDAGNACRGRGDALPNLSVESGDGLALEVLSIDPEPPIVGDNAWDVALRRDGEPLIGAQNDIVVLPTMPDHNHGTPVTVGVRELSDGVYRLAPVNTRMPGYWEIDVRVDTDAGARSLLFGVCIE